MNKYIKSIKNTYAFITEFKSIGVGLLKFMQNLESIISLN